MGCAGAGALRAESNNKSLRRWQGKSRTLPLSEQDLVTHTPWRQ